MVPQDACLRLVVDDGADGAAGVFGRGDLEAARRFHQPRQEGVVQPRRHDRPAARRAFLAGVAEGAGDDAVDRLVQVGVVVDDDGVLAAHLGDDALDVVLSGPRFGGLAVDVQADVARAGEGDHGRRRMLHQLRPDFLAHAGEEIHHARRQADFLEDLHQLGADDARLLGRLHDRCVAGDEGGRGHAAQDGHREVPRSDDHGDAARFVEVDVLLAGGVAPPRHGQSQHFAAVKVAIVDGLGHVGVGLAPRLAALVNLPGRQLEAAPAHHLRGVEQVLRPPGRFRVAPVRERRGGRLDGLARLLRRGGGRICRRSADGATG